MPGARLPVGCSQWWSTPREVKFPLKQKLNPNFLPLSYLGLFSSSALPEAPHPRLVDLGRQGQGYAQVQKVRKGSEWVFVFSNSSSSDPQSAGPFSIPPPCGQAEHKGRQAQYTARLDDGYHQKWPGKEIFGLLTNFTLLMYKQDLQGLGFWVISFQFLTSKNNPGS